MLGTGGAQEPRSLAPGGLSPGDHATQKSLDACDGCPSLTWCPGAGPSQGFRVAALPAQVHTLFGAVVRLGTQQVFFFFFNFMYLFIYGCVGSSFLCEGFL